MSIEERIKSMQLLVNSMQVKFMDAMGRIDQLEERQRQINGALMMLAREGLTPGEEDEQQKEPEPLPISDGAAEIMKERARQICVLGYDAEHDDHHTKEQLILAAMAFLAAVRGLPERKVLDYYWPNDWGTRWIRTSRTKRERLVIAGAMIAAEIDRIDRAEKGAK